MIEYRLNNDSRLVLTDPAILHFKKSRQLRVWSRESGGQLFATFDGPVVTVREVTGPRRSDRRGRWYFRPDRAAEIAEITVMYKRGLHFIGDWHTHPQDVPQPSTLDVDSLADCVRRSEHQLLGFFLIVVGRQLPPEGLHVSYHDGTKFHWLSPLLD